MKKLISLFLILVTIFVLSLSVFSCKKTETTTTTTTIEDVIEDVDVTTDEEITNIDGE